MDQEDDEDVNNNNNNKNNNNNNQQHKPLKRKKKPSRDIVPATQNGRLYDEFTQQPMEIEDSNAENEDSNNSEDLEIITANFNINNNKNNRNINSNNNNNNKNNRRNKNKQKQNVVSNQKQHQRQLDLQAFRKDVDGADGEDGDDADDADDADEPIASENSDDKEPQVAYYPPFLLENEALSPTPSPEHTPEPSVPQCQYGRKSDKESLISQIFATLGPVTKTISQEYENITGTNQDIWLMKNRYRISDKSKYRKNEKVAVLYLSRFLKLVCIQFVGIITDFLTVSEDRFSRCCCVDNVTQSSVRSYGIKRKNEFMEEEKMNKWKPKNLRDTNITTWKQMIVTTPIKIPIYGIFCDHFNQSFKAFYIEWQEFITKADVTGNHINTILPIIFCKLLYLYFYETFATFTHNQRREKFMEGFRTERQSQSLRGNVEMETPANYKQQRKKGIYDEDPSSDEFDDADLTDNSFDADDEDDEDYHGEEPNKHQQPMVMEDDLQNVVTTQSLRNDWRAIQKLMQLK